MEFLNQLQSLIASDPERMRVLRLVRELDLPDCWVAAGFVRNCVWDFMHQREPTLYSQDIDVIWYDPLQATAARDAIVEATLRGRDNTLRWSVKNQARMHERNADRPYRSADDAMKHWPETATAVGIRLNAEGQLEVSAPFGLDDLFALVVRPTERFMAEKRSIYANRIHTKRWQLVWPNLSIELSC
ncbi:nucleotidyltransferase family protein [Massilia sp. IC2-476]|uniref:nucleotidyltransferase family protein n=1 Tax=Massilia sp. IC2-476 TaxID=2887199 RepID=UPI001D104AD0|nr:nucleotidyltransferase family protein [Massilia sp. IC2-476]MCC2974002.1 nucleotidyltransferase family protein [Massilia sp. IC2-476]